MNKGKELKQRQKLFSDVVTTDPNSKAIADFYKTLSHNRSGSRNLL